eukprot:m.257911 g.257911  ORF g.257911 m.257911 type:complete len:524 (-) comp27710_c0_seq1:410-1981(-)
MRRAKVSAVRFSTATCRSATSARKVSSGGNSVLSTSQSSSAATVRGMISSTTSLSTERVSIEPIGIRKPRMMKARSGAISSRARIFCRRKARPRLFLSGSPSWVDSISVLVSLELILGSLSGSAPGRAKSLGRRCNGQDPASGRGRIQFTALLGQPGLEAGVHLVAIVGPPGVVEHEGAFDVIRRGRHVRTHRNTQLGMVADQRGRGRPGRTIRDIRGLIGQTLGVGREIEIVHHASQVVFGQAFGDHPAVEVEHLVAPGHADGLVLLGDGREQTTVIGRTHEDFAIGQKLRRFGAGGPPDGFVLDRVQHGESALDALVGFQHVVDVFDGHAVTQQRPFHVADRTTLQRAAARIGFQVEHGAGIGRRLGAFGDHVGAVAEGRRIDDLRDEALGYDHVAEIFRRRGAVRRSGQHFVMLDRHRQAFVAQTHRVRGDHVDQIPGDVVGFEHRAHPRHGIARAFVGDDRHLGMHFLIGLVIGVHLRLLVSTAPGHDGHFIGHILGERATSGQREDAGGPHHCGLEFH